MPASAPSAGYHRLRAAGISLAASVAVLGVKVAAYLVTGSVALLSDAAESVVNILAANIALVSLLVASRPADEGHQYGHAKAEYVSSATEGAMIAAAGGWIVLTAARRLLDPRPLAHLPAGLLLLVVGTALNLGVALYLLRVSRSERSIALEASARHLLSDVITSAGVFVGLGLVTATRWLPLDAIAAALVGANIGWMGASLLRRSISGLMDARFPPQDEERIRAVFDAHRGDVVEYHAMRTRQAGADRFLDLHLVLHRSLSVGQAHTICDHLEHHLEEALPGVDVTIHVEPCSAACPRCSAQAQDRLREWQEAGFAQRIWARDATLWSAAWPGGPAPELADRLGWLALPDTMQGQIADLEDFAREIAGAGVRHVALLGMGGSSMAPEVFGRTFGAAPGAPGLIVLDSTHPAAVRRVESQMDLGRTLFVVSSKSGTTPETLSFLRYFWSRVAQKDARPGQRFVAITDPGTPLERLAQERGFRRVFLGPPDVGGRYSALSVFGLVPAALLGVDLRRLLARARRMAADCGPSSPAPRSPGLVLGAVLGENAMAGRDKLTLLASRSLAGLPAWIEQLVAESTGKDGKGIVPIADEPLAAPLRYGADRVFAYVRLADDPAEDLHALASALEAAGHPVFHLGLAEKADLGAEFFRWEMAVAAAGAALGIHPFNQPDVQLAKDMAREAMARRAAADGRTADLDVPDAATGDWATWLRPGDYLGLQVYLAPDETTTALLAEIRRAVADRYGVATTLGYGPRFLHSTGQLHKGGPQSGVFVQIVDDPADDLEIPEEGYTFGELIRAQAMGDLRALAQRGRRVARMNVGRDAPGALARLAQRLVSAPGP